nr:MAG TPA: hypothetical protein [Bacteriophage sp.]
MVSRTEGDCCWPLLRAGWIAPPGRPLPTTDGGGVGREGRLPPQRGQPILTSKTHAHDTRVHPAMGRITAPACVFAQAPHISVEQVRSGSLFRGHSSKRVVGQGHVRVTSFLFRLLLTSHHFFPGGFGRGRDNSHIRLLIRGDGLTANADPSRRRPQQSPAVANNHGTQRLTIGSGRGVSGRYSAGSINRIGQSFELRRGEAGEGTGNRHSRSRIHRAYRHDVRALDAATREPAVDDGRVAHRNMGERPPIHKIYRATTHSGNLLLEENVAHLRRKLGHIVLLGIHLGRTNNRAIIQLKLVNPRDTDGFDTVALIERPGATVGNDINVGRELAADIAEIQQPVTPRLFSHGQGAAELMHQTPHARTRRCARLVFHLEFEPGEIRSPQHDDLPGSDREDRRIDRSVFRAPQRDTHSKLPMMYPMRPPYRSPRTVLQQMQSFCLKGNNHTL